ncbi:protein Dml1p [Trichomonascus vanleenenianus]|uniref:Dml1p n=1 Tax=Trichomonascus vanleenenianus TaxID=2268995 RepID=UPI003EC9994D
MHEVIHLSFSPIGNHLHSHYYNAQETYFVFDEDEAKSSNVDPSVAFHQGTKAVSPRALIWDTRHGYGAMKRYNPLFNYDNDAEGNPVPVESMWGGPVTTIDTPRVPKSEYQQALDTGSTLPKLTTANTTNWADYLHFYYHPSSLLWLSNSTYGAPGSDANPFHDFKSGVTQWEELNNDKEYLENTFRGILESADSLNGINVVTDVDSGWGGLTAKLLEELRDDYIPKAPIFTWAVYKNGKISRAQQLSRIATTLSLVKTASLYFPLSSVPKLPEKFDRTVDLNSPWHLSALYNIPFESLALLSSLRGQKRVSMQTIADSLQAGTNRTVVSAINGAISTTGLIDYSVNEFGDSRYTFAKAGILRPAAKPSAGVVEESISLQDFLHSTNVVADPWTDYFKEKELLDQGTPESALTKFICEEPYALPTSHPDFITSSDEIYSSFAVTDGAKKAFRQMASIIASTPLPVDDREETKQELNNLAEEYDYAWSDDEEFDI